MLAESAQLKEQVAALQKALAELKRLKEEARLSINEREKYLGIAPAESGRSREPDGQACP